MLPSLGAIYFSLFSLFSAVWAKSSTGNSVLVLLQPELKRDDFDIFFNNLAGKPWFLVTGDKGDQYICRTWL
jgi:oligosaccharyltransferase complex subunit beta